MKVIKVKRNLLCLGFILVSACTANDGVSTDPVGEPIETKLINTPQVTPEETAEVSPTALPTPTPTPLACLSGGGEVFDDAIVSESLPHELEFRVYLPPCYDAQQSRRYPVLYLIHGQTFDHSQWDRLGATQVADEMISQRGSEPFIIVMPRDLVWVQPSKDFFGVAFINDLIPYIDATYRTLDDRDYRVIGGLSRGASWALHLGIDNWEMFSAVGMHSLPIFWEDAPKVPEWLDEIPPDQYPRIYLDVATYDEDAIEESTAWFVEQLKQRAIPFEWHLYVGFHEEGYWTENIENYMRFYTRGW